MNYVWRFALPEEFNELCTLFLSSELGKGKAFSDIQRRIIIPLLLQHLITFYDGMGKLCGFITFAWLKDECEEHMPTSGILPTDWRGGRNFWAVDFIVNKGCDGYKMLRAVTKDLGIKKAKYFRHKHQEVREVRPL